MIIAYDSINYEHLGRMLAFKNWTSYFATGPNREPLYPLLVAASMHIEHITGLSFLKVMAAFGVMILVLTQVLMYKVLRLLNVRDWICAVVLAYFALSPAVNNAAFSLYSEIATLPIILGIILASACAWEAVRDNNRRRALAYGTLLGLLLTAATLVKAVFEGITPAYLVIFSALVILKEKKVKIFTLLICLAVAVSFYYVPIMGYKRLNEHFNDNFAVTNRASWALYGNTARRMEPLNSKRFAEALAYMPGEGVCNGIFGAKECDFWSFRESDELGFAKSHEIERLHLSPREANARLLSLSAYKALHNPFQYVLLTAVEALKMFFWESTKIGFVSYPPWLQRIYDIKIFNNSLRLFIALMTLIGVVSLWCGVQVSRSPIVPLMGGLIALYILFYAFFFILTRYALPIAPLYLIAIGIWINKK